MLKESRNQISSVEFRANHQFDLTGRRRLSTTCTHLDVTTLHLTTPQHQSQWSPLSLAWCVRCVRANGRLDGSCANPFLDRLLPARTFVGSTITDNRSASVSTLTLPLGTMSTRIKLTCSLGLGTVGGYWFWWVITIRGVLIRRYSVHVPMSAFPSRQQQLLWEVN